MNCEYVVLFGADSVDPDEIQAWAHAPQFHEGGNAGTPRNIALQLGTIADVVFDVDHSIEFRSFGVDPEIIESPRHVQDVCKA